MRFMERINECLEALACHYAGKTLFNKPWNRDANNVFCWADKKGDPAAFEKYVRGRTADLPKPSVSVFI